MSTQRKRKIGIAYGPSEKILNKMSGDGTTLINRTTPVTTKVTIATTQRYKELLGEYKVINDPIHGHFELPKLLFKFIDTPQFQRLRHIKQLGATDLVFPGATHNRFEHSLGVAHLAGKMCQKLKVNQPELKITDADVLCLQIAGLCHDLGHGPFSHFFDGLFMPEARSGFQWKHEQGSVAMLEHLIEVNNLAPVLEECGLTDTDIYFIKELLFGPLKRNETEVWPYKGRDEEKSYLYEIVANKRTGIDVDKWDYFARDCYHLGISNNFDYKRYMKFARVVSVDGKLQICTRDKEVSTLYDMFHTRNSLHRRAYQHKTVKIIDKMYRDALVKADGHLLIEGRNRKKLKISQCVEDMVAYTKLNDSIFNIIDVSEDEKLKDSKELLQRIYRRDLYHLVGQTILGENISKSQHQFLRRSITDMIKNCDTIDKEDFDIHVIEFNYGMEDRNPIDEVRFYNKHKPYFARKLKKDQVSQMLPEKFAERHLRFYYKGHDTQILKEAKVAFRIWCEAKAFSRIGVNTPELTEITEDPSVTSRTYEDRR